MGGEMMQYRKHRDDIQFFLEKDLKKKEVKKYEKNNDSG